MNNKGIMMSIASLFALNAGDYSSHIGIEKSGAGEKVYRTGGGAFTKGKRARSQKIRSNRRKRK